VGLGSWTVEWVTGVENEEEKRNEEREKKSYNKIIKILF
jgi:hypothetical protein